MKVNLRGLKFFYHATLRLYFAFFLFTNNIDRHNLRITTHLVFLLSFNQDGSTQQTDDLIEMTGEPSQSLVRNCHLYVFAIM